MSAIWKCRDCGGINPSEWEECAACAIMSQMAEIEQLKGWIERLIQGLDSDEYEQLPSDLREWWMSGHQA